MIDLDKNIEAELWTLDQMYQRRGHDIGTWETFNVIQFASAYAHYRLYTFLNENPRALPDLLALVRLASLTKTELQKMMPTEKKSLSRLELYQVARSRFMDGKEAVFYPSKTKKQQQIEAGHQRLFVEMEAVGL